MIPGTLLDGRYRVLQRLGRGGQADIFVARDEHRRQNVAIKSQFPRTFESTTEYASLAFPLEEELDRLKFMATVPGIPKVLGHGHYGRSGCRYIVMELIEGSTVSSWIRDHEPVQSAEAVSVIGQLCEILTRLHAKGYVHRDVTPNNTMVQPDGRVRLLDVGISVTAGEVNTYPGGSPGYAAPEQYDRSASLTPQVDVFALGAMLFAMTVSELPYTSLEHPLDHAAPAFPEDFSAEMHEPLRTLGLAMVSIDPRERPNGVAEVLRSVRPMLPVLGAPASPKASRPDPTTPYRLGFSVP
ncbi:serine/threonine protein kinase [Streptomyces rectiverticillatus]|uniref:serine/threonine-protein kinase n=1 Tax=Streptomyces rectiverticillatus TaxID=173860 RepID=UPI0015C3C763|nr:serine/threonine-protein kinase [Streptomyces rectiverticillatus]QLE74414.1 serine/threonine protein kinase [Streptomyces rectiverticillatus]